MYQLFFWLQYDGPVVIDVASQVGDTQIKFYPVMVGIKGDWPYIRKAVHMAVGFKSKRVCHLCPGREPQLHICMQIYVYTKDWINQKYVPTCSSLAIGIETIVFIFYILWILYCRAVPRTSSSHSAHAQEWWNMTAEGEARSWEGEVPNPLRPGPRSPLLRIPGISFESCQPDVLHVFNLGVGADLAISGILAIFRMGLWGGSTIGTALNTAYERFRHWCLCHRQTPFIKSFDLGKFHMSSSLGLMG